MMIICKILLSILVLRGYSAGQALNWGAPSPARSTKTSGVLWGAQPGSGSTASTSKVFAISVKDSEKLQRKSERENAWGLTKTPKVNPRFQLQGSGTINFDRGSWDKPVDTVKKIAERQQIGRYCSI